MLRTRIYTVLVVLPLFLGGMFFAPNWAWALLLAPLMLIGAWEWGGLSGWRPSVRVAYALVMGVCGVWLWHYATGDAARGGALSRIVLGVSVVFWLVVVPTWLAKSWKVHEAVTMAVVGGMVLLPTWLALVQLQVQPATLLMLMVIVWLSDTAAYFCGKRWGRRKLAVTISPGKTWEGALGALVGVALYYAILNAAGLTGHVALQGFLGAGAFLSLMVLGMEGDLFESWIKRTAGVKDSGTVFPGHGGVLDRIDALTASMPAAALILSGGL